MEKHKKISNIYLIGSIMISGLILLCALYQAKIYPFGDSTLIYHDMEYQYLEFLIWFRNVLHGKDNLFYSFSIGMGSGTASLFAYYLASPFNFLLLFASEEHFVLWISFIMMLKIVACSVSMFCYLDKRYEIKPFYSMLLAVSYAMMGYNVLNCSNIMWLDGVFILPFLALGIYQLVWKQKKGLYFIGLLYGVLANWYIGYMLCIFATVYFCMECVLYYFEHPYCWKNLVCKILTFGVTSILACFATSALLLPQTLQMLAVGESNVDDVMHYGFNFSYLDGFKDIFLNGDKLTWSQEHPSIYVGSLPLLFVGLFFEHSVERKKKLFGGIVLGSAMLFYAFVPLSYLFSFAKVPSNHYFRHSFLYSFLLISVAGLFLQSFHIKKGSLLRAAVIMAGGGLIYEKLVSYSERNLMYMSLIIMLLIGLGLEIREHSGHVGMIMASVFLFLCMGKEYTTNWTLELADHNYSKEKIMLYTHGMGNIIDMLRTSDDSIYRMDKTGTRFGSLQRNECNSESMAFGYSGIAHYSSARNTGVGKFLTAMGYGSGSDVMVYDAIQPIDALLGVKYVISGMGLSGYEKIYEDVWNDADVYQNIQALPLGYAVTENIEAEWGCNPFENHMGLLAGITGEEALIYSELDVLTVNTDNATYTEWEMQVREDGPVYLYSINGVSGTTFYINDTRLSSNIWYNNQIIIAGYHYAGDVLKVKIIGSSQIPDSGFYAVTLREEAYTSLMSKIQNYSCRIDTLQNGTVTAFYEADEETKLLFTIPYEPGWRVTVNGQRVDYETYAGAFMNITVPKGQNEIRMEYHTPGLVVGSIVSIATILLFTIWNKGVILKTHIDSPHLLFD